MSSYVSLSKNKFKHFKKALGAGNPCIFFPLLVNVFQFVYQDTLPFYFKDARPMEDRRGHQILYS